MGVARNIYSNPSEADVSTAILQNRSQWFRVMKRILDISNYTRLLRLLIQKQ